MQRNPSPNPARSKPTTWARLLMAWGKLNAPPNVPRSVTIGGSPAASGSGAPSVAAGRESSIQPSTNSPPTSILQICARIVLSLSLCRFSGSFEQRNGMQIRVHELVGAPGARVLPSGAAHGQRPISGRRSYQLLAVDDDDHGHDDPQEDSKERIPVDFGGGCRR